MGMSASQARMLSLTSRLSDLEYQSQSISNSKLRLADQSTAASQKYQDALSKEKLTVMVSSSSTVDANAYNLTTYNAISTTDKQRFVTDLSGRILVTSSVGSAYDDSQNVGSTSYYLKHQVGRDTDGNGTDDTYGYNSSTDFLNDFLGYYDETTATAAGVIYDEDAINYYTNVYSGKEEFLNSLGYTSDSSTDQAYTTALFGAPSSATYDSGADKYYSNVFEQIAKNGYNCPGDGKMVDSEWLYNQLNSGTVYLSEWSSSGGDDGSGGWENVSWSSGDPSLQTASDTSQIAKAEAEYETDMAQIKSQDNKYDLQLKEIDTQHSAIQTEIDSVKKVIDKNIERSYKVFNG